MWVNFLRWNLIIMVYVVLNQIVTSCKNSCKNPTSCTNSCKIQLQRTSLYTNSYLWILSDSKFCDNFWYFNFWKFWLTPRETFYFRLLFISKFTITFCRHQLYNFDVSNLQTFIYFVIFNKFHFNLSLLQ